ncbi:vacuolar iron transporter homolog 4-like [Glycine soja]|uniref:vacuolar iron transporter homolog 4-like n=1 Tax=Glycine soja TaxID=3848 RepID=UPI00103885F0|nr:vacuolar iron transporter homolog 4-like [Glycine soja]
MENNNIQPCHDDLDRREANNPPKMLNLEVEGQREGFDYAKRPKWLRAAVLGANDGFVSTTSLMMGVGGVRKDVKSMLLTGVAGMVAGVCSLAIGDFVFVYSQYAIGIGVQLLGAAFFNTYKARLGVVVAVVTLALIIFGDLGAFLGKAPRVKSTLRVLIGGLLAMAITFSLTNVVGSSGL